MPWENNKNDGPWGKAPQPPPQQQQPDLDDYLRKLRQQMNNLFGKGGAPGGRSILLAVVGILVLWLASGFYVVDAKEEGVVLRFGKYHRKSTPGLHYHFPYPLETLTKVPVTVVNSIEIGMRSGGSRAGIREMPQESLMLTGDENIVDINFEVQWRISDAEKFLFNVRDPEGTVKNVAESAMREVIGRTPIADALAEGKLRIQQEALVLLQNTLNSYNSGIEIVALQLRKVDPPQAVIDAFRDVQTARADMERARNEAETYRNDIIPRARGDAARIVQDAEAYKSEIVARSEGEAKRFIAVYDQYKLAKDVTRKRMYLETMEKVLGGINKVLIDTKGGPNVVPLLSLKDLVREAETKKEAAQ
jgi:membrane protease subunit HflK